MMQITIFTHPNCNGEYLDHLSNMIKKYSKVSVNVEQSWKKVKYIENIEGLKIYALSDPFKTIENCMNVYDEMPTNKSLRWNFIKDEMGYDLKEYSKIEAATLSYLLWLEIAKKYQLDHIFKIESPKQLFNFLIEKEIINNFYFQEHQLTKYDFNAYQDMISDTTYGTLNLLAKFCEEYQYENYLKRLQ